MSRVAKAPVLLPPEVEISIQPHEVSVKGKMGELKQACHHLVKVTRVDENGGQLIFEPTSKDQSAWAQAGTMRALVNNMVTGVSKGFERALELVGVGFRAQLSGQVLNLSLGFSHPVRYELPKGIKAEVSNNTSIVLKSSDKQLLGQVASEIRSLRPPEPYKGKGVRYSGENIIRKEVKKK